jgi:hypothetical protein
MFTEVWLWYPNDNRKTIKLLDSKGLYESEDPTEFFELATPL